MESVKKFNGELLFNFIDDVEVYVNYLKENNEILEYEDLNTLLKSKKNLFGSSQIKTVLDGGCGTGWLSNSLSYHYGKKVKAIDIKKKAIKLAKEVSLSLNQDVEFLHSDIFNYEDNNLYDLVISLGVLHHTSDCKLAFKKLSRFVKKGGYIYIGLYHLYGRLPMLQLLQSHSYWYGEESSFNLFKRMNRNNPKSEKHSYSFFKDQILHANETQHTLKEVSEWLNEIGFKLKTTSIGKYDNHDSNSLEKLYDKETKLHEYSHSMNFINKEFYPGYFTVCAQRV